MSKAMTVAEAGRKGGRTRARNLSSDALEKSARKAARVRWRNHAKRLALAVPVSENGEK